jgi:hypothetical protein
VGCTSGSGTDGQRSDARGSEDASARAATAAKPCARGTFTWSNVTKRERLTGASAAEDLGADGGKLQNPLRRVYTPRVSVRSQGSAPAPAEVLFSLGKKAAVIDSNAQTLGEAADGESWAFTDVRTPAPKLDKGPVALDGRGGAGTFVQYAGVKEVEADFHYSCPKGGTATGHARSWTVDVTGVLDCGHSVETDLARAAARHSCDQGAPAGEDAA